MKCDICTKLVKERGFKKGFHGARIICARDRILRLTCSFIPHDVQKTEF